MPHTKQRRESWCAVRVNLREVARKVERVNECSAQLGSDVGCKAEKSDFRQARAGEERKGKGCLHVEKQRQSNSRSAKRKFEGSVPFIIHSQSCSCTSWLASLCGFA